ncbi:MAG: prepilin peptidase [Methanobacterium sp.]|nr:prepilin peptidase [Methanobacterium sp.]
MDIYYIPLIAVIIAILACFYASYSDIKRGIIPNKLTFPLIGLGLVLNLIYALLIGNLWLAVFAAVITVVIFVLGYLFWRMGAWAGGDVKLFTALAALLAIYPPLINYKILNYQMPVYASYPFPFTLIINSILSMLPFLLIYVIYIAVKTKPHLLKILFSPIKEYRKNFLLTLVVTSAVTITLFIVPHLPFQNILISLILIYIISWLISKLPNLIKAVLVTVITLFALYQNIPVTISGIVVVFISILFIGIIQKLLTKVNKEALQDDYKIDQLEEGMIPAYALYQKGDEVYFDDKGTFQKIREAITSGDISLIRAPKGKQLISILAAGLKKEDIELLKKLTHDGKIPETFKVKKGVPFAPSILIGLLISLFIGDLAIIFLNVLNWLLY